MAEFFINLVVFVVSLGLLVVIHEFGHFITAKMFNVYVTEFSIGFGPALYTKKKDGKETRFSIRGVPLGGYCAMVGEAAPEFTEEEYEKLSDKDKELVDLYKTVPPERKLDGIAKWKRAIIMVAGVTLNFLLGFVLLFVFSLSTTFATMYDNVVAVSDNSIAQQAGWTSEDVIYSGSYVINLYNTDGTLKETKTQTVDCSDKTDELYKLVVDLSQFTPSTENDTAYFTFITSTNKEINFELKPTLNASDNNYYWPTIGISFQANLHSYTKKLNFGEALGYAGELWCEYAVLIFKSIGMLFTKEGIAQVGGVISIFTVQQQVMSMGFTYVINLWAMISINLAIFNLLPFPGLDGWHLLVIIIEGITRREMPKKVKEVMSTVGMILLFGLMIAVTLKDIIGLF